MSATTEKASSLKTLIEHVIEDLKGANTIIVPQVIALVKAVSQFSTNEKVKEICDKIIEVLKDAQSITPDVIKLLEDIDALL